MELFDFEFAFGEVAVSASQGGTLLVNGLAFDGDDDDEDVFEGGRGGDLLAKGEGFLVGGVFLVEFGERLPGLPGHVQVEEDEVGGPVHEFAHGRLQIGDNTYLAVKQVGHVLDGFAPSREVINY